MNCYCGNKNRKINPWHEALSCRRLIWFIEFGHDRVLEWKCIKQVYNLDILLLSPSFYINEFASFHIGFMGFYMNLIWMNCFSVFFDPRNIWGPSRQQQSMLFMFFASQIEFYKSVPGEGTESASQEHGCKTAERVC